MLFSNFTAFSLGNNFHLHSTCTLLFGKKIKLFLAATDFQFCLSVINAGKFFGLEDDHRDVCSTALKKGS